jgi:hypothetical protein
VAVVTVVSGRVLGMISKHLLNLKRSHERSIADSTVDDFAGQSEGGPIGSTAGHEVCVRG